MQFEQIAPDVFRARQRPHPTRWFGLPFALVSLMPFAGAVGILDFKDESGGAASPWLLAPFGAVFLSIGLGLLLWRRRVVVDRRAGTVTRVGGVLFVRRTATREVAAFDLVAHFRRVIRGDKSSRIVYPVALESERGAEFLLVNCRDARTARQAAEQVAKLCELPLVDRTDGSERRREVADLDLSLRDRRERGDGVEDPGAPPSGIRSAIDVQGDELEVTIPGFGFSAMHVVAMLFATGPVWMVLVFLTATGAGAEGTFLVVATAMAAIPTLLLEVAIVWHALRRWTVRASNRELRVVEHGLRPRTTVIPAGELEDVALPDAGGRSLDAFVGGGPPITAISDDAQVAFGQSLKHREADYLAKVLRAALSAPIG